MKKIIASKRKEIEVSMLWFESREEELKREKGRASMRRDWVYAWFVNHIFQSTL